MAERMSYPIPDSMEPEQSPRYSNAHFQAACWLHVNRAFSEDAINKSRRGKGIKRSNFPWRLPFYALFYPTQKLVPTMRGRALMQASIWVVTGKALAYLA